MGKPSIGMYWGLLAKSRPDHLYGAYGDFFHGRTIEANESDHSDAGADWRDEPIYLRKNIANLAPVFMPDGCHLVVDAEVRKIIERHADVGFVRAIISEAWCFAYGTSEEYLRDSAWPEPGYGADFDWDTVADAFARKYFVEPPQTELYCVRDYGWWLHQSDSAIPSFVDANEAVLPPEVRSHLIGTPVLSRSLIERVGMYHSWAYICTPRLLSELVPFLEPSFFVTHVQDF